jgi:hypothetical protein
MGRGDVRCTDQEFIRLYEANGKNEIARILNIDAKHVASRRRRLEASHGSIIANPNSKDWASQYPSRLPIELRDGIAIIGSDAHYWPDIISPAHLAMVKLCKELKPKLVCLNGDVVDGAAISRHPPLGWENKPKVNEELETCLERTGEIESASKGATLLWNVGNHDARFDARLAQQNSEFEKVKGFTLREHFPKWKFAMSSWVNDDVVIKHRYKGGIHATHNNALGAGKTIVTGHLHSLKVTPLSDYNGNRFGVDTGTLADIYGPQFAYMEDNPANWRSGFAVLTFHRGKLLWPEVCHVRSENEVEFRGKIFKP